MWSWYRASPERVVVIVPSLTGGSSTSTARAPVAISSTSGRPVGLPTSSSAVISTCTGRAGSPIARSASSPVTMPAFMSRAPGPQA